MRRRELRRMAALSAAAHGVLVLALVLAPDLGRSRAVLPPAIPVELVAAPEGAAPAPEPPAPAPRPAPPAPAQKVVLPETPAEPKPEPRPEPEPKPVPPPPTPPHEPEPRPEPRPEPEPVPQRSLDEVMRELRAEAGEAEPAPERTARAVPGAGAAAGAAERGARGAQVSPEVAAWLRRARIHVRNRWVLAPGFRTQALETHVVVTLDAEGRVVEEPEITRPSGNPWYDESVVRALVKASPLPPPPEPGEWPFVFQPGDSL